MAERRNAAVAERAVRPKAPKPMSAAQRKSLATQQLLKELTGGDQAAAITAALEIINERLAWDMALRQNLCQRYAEIETLGKAKQKTDLGPMPKPIQTPGITKQSPLTVLDPYDLRDTYGSDQLRAVLMRAGLRDLREAVVIVQSQEPDAKAPNRSRKADMIDYIVEHVAGPGY